MRVEQLLTTSAARVPAKTALVCGSERVTYEALANLAARIAGGLTAAGMRRGDRVAVCLGNSVEAVAALFGVAQVGAAFVMIAPQSKPGSVAQILEDCGAAFVIDRASFDDLARVGAATEQCDPGGEDGDLAALIYTSGSTGASKGVMLTHRNITAAASSICEYLEMTERDVVLSALPLHFSYGLGQVTTVLSQGATLVLERSFTYPAAILDTLERERATGLPLVPTMATLLLQQDLSSRRLPHLRFITNAAAALSPDKMRRLRSAFPSAKLYSMYGQTECQRACYLPPDQLDVRPESVGVPIPGTDAFVADETGRRVAPGVVGELVVRGPHVMQGYWNQPEATARVLRRSAGGEMLLWTGDFFRADAEGFLYFVDRKDDMIKTRGEKVAPRAVEAVIAEMPGVAEVAVFGVPDDVLGQAIVAAVLPHANVTLTAAEVRRHCAQRLEPYMVPAAVDIRAAVPMTASGKVSRLQLRAERAIGSASA